MKSASGRGSGPGRRPGSRAGKTTKTLPGVRTRQVARRGTSAKSKVRPQAGARPSTSVRQPDVAPAPTTPQVIQAEPSLDAAVVAPTTAGDSLHAGSDQTVSAPVPTPVPQADLPRDEPVSVPGPVGVPPAANDDQAARVEVPRAAGVIRAARAPAALPIMPFGLNIFAAQAALFSETVVKLWQNQTSIPGAMRIGYEQSVKAMNLGLDSVAGSVMEPLTQAQNALRDAARDKS